MLGRWAPLGTGDIRDTHAFLTRIAGRFPDNSGVARGPVRAVLWSPSWIPFAKDGAGDALCVDSRPPDGGLLGQIVEYRHDDPNRFVVAPSLAAWFSDFADDLDAGRFEVDDFLGSLHDRD